MSVTSIVLPYLRETWVVAMMEEYQLPPAKMVMERFMVGISLREKSENEEFREGSGENAESNCSGLLWHKINRQNLAGGEWYSGIQEIRKASRKASTTLGRWFHETIWVKI